MISIALGIGDNVGGVTGSTGRISQLLVSCLTWHLRSKQTPHTFQLFLHVFLRCSYDYLEVRDGSMLSANLISRLCGNTRPSTQHSTGSSILLRFRTDTSVTHKGFKAKFSIGKFLKIPEIINNVQIFELYIHFNPILF